MLREEVWKGWEVIKEKINQFKLTPQDKKVVEYLDKSDLITFSTYSVLDLDQAEKKFKKEEDEINILDPENDLIFSYWVVASNLVSLILNWINLRRTTNSYQVLFKELEREKEEAKSELERLLKRNGKRFTRKKVITESIMNELKEIINEYVPNQTSVDKLWILEEKINNFDYITDVHEPSVEDDPTIEEVD